MRLAPSNWLLRLILFPLLLAVPMTLLGLTSLWWTGLALLALVAAVDALLGARTRPLEVERRMARIWPLGVRGEVRLRLHNPGRRTLRGDLFDHHPPGHAVDGLPCPFLLAPGDDAEAVYGLIPRRRGPATFARPEVRVYSLLALWWVHFRVGEEEIMRVYPNYAEVVKYGVLAGARRLGQMGVMKRRQRGEGTEFHQLREFRRGDRLAAIDWKATSRQGKLIAREFQEETDQQIFFLIECGRRMRAQDGDLAHFDHVLNAVLLLSHVALRQGDAVGLMTFGGVHRWLKPTKKTATAQAVMEILHDLEPTQAPSDHLQAAEESLRILRKRALVIVVTNLRDEDSDELLPAVKLLRRQHLVVVASLREKALDQAAREPVRSAADGAFQAALGEYLHGRRELLARLNAQGARSLDVIPEELAISLVNRYWEMKSAGVG